MPRSTALTLTDGNYINGEQYTAASTFPKDEYQYWFESSDGTSTVRHPAQIDIPATLSFEIIKTPVVIVPGILGSKLTKDGILGSINEVWPDFLNRGLSRDDSYLNDLILNKTGNIDSNNPVLFTDGIFREEFGIDFIKGLITELKNNGYVEGEDLFVFPYDWRLRNETSALVLKSKVDEVLLQTSANKVDIIAHSMGGLVSKYYIKNYGNQLVRKFVDVATPHLGTPKAFKQLVYGDNLDIAPLGIHILNKERNIRRSTNTTNTFSPLIA